MCEFFSFVTEPENHGGERFYFNWNQRKKGFDGADSHDHIIQHYNLNSNICNTYEYNPLTKVFDVDQINSSVNDKVQAQEWVEGLDFKKIVKPLIVKPIINPFKLKKVNKPNDEQVQLLKQWDSVRASVWASVGASVWASVGDSVWASVGALVWASVWASVRAYISSFFDIKYKYDFTPVIKLWEQGLVPSFHGTVWRLHSGKNAKIVFEINKKELQEYK